MITVFAAETSSEPAPFSSTEEQKAAFDALPDDAIVCHVMGVPVYKYEIDENGIIHKDFSAYVNSPSSRSSALLTGTLVSPHKNETITANMIQNYTGYSETNEIVYMHRSEALNSAQAFRDQASQEYSITQMLGESGVSIIDTSPYYSLIAGIVGAILVLDAFSRDAIATNLTNTANANPGAQLIHVASRYGIFYSVNPWNGTTVYKPSTYQQGSSTITVTSVYCTHGNLW